jgi:hypothetical protein
LAQKHMIVRGKWKGRFCIGHGYSHFK